MLHVKHFFLITDSSLISNRLCYKNIPSSMKCYLLWYIVFVASCGTVDGAYGPVRNPWRYQFHQQADQHMQHASSSNLASNVARVVNHARDYQVSSSSAFNVETECSNASDADVDNTDWYITGGSSGGSAVAVATGVAFA